MQSKKLVWQLIPPFLFIILLSSLAIAINASISIKELYYEQIAEELKVKAILFERALLYDNPSGRINEVDDLCKELGDLISTRITVILPNGEVIGDTHRDPTLMDNHASRPEVIEALNGKVGISTRFSSTLSQEMKYVAIPVVRNGTHLAVLRSSVPGAELNRKLSGVYNKIIFFIIPVAFFATVISFIVSRKITKPIEQMRNGAAHFADGDFDFRISSPYCEELKSLADVMNYMAKQLSDRIDTITRQKNALDVYNRTLEEKVEERTRELQHSKNEVETLFQTTPNGIITTDLDYNIILANRRALDLFASLGISSLNNEQLTDLLPDSNRGQLEKMHDDLIENGSTKNVLFTFTGSDNQKLFIETDASIIINKHRHPTIISIWRDISDRINVQQALAYSEEKYRNLVENINDAVFSIDQSGCITFMSSAVERFSGYDACDMIGLKFDEFIYRDDIGMFSAHYDNLQENMPLTCEFRFKNLTGGILWVRASIQPAIENGVYTGAHGILTDISENKRLEEQFIQAQKMETVGRLAGGIAHDFNNLLTVISGNSALVLRTLSESSPLHKRILEISKTSDRAAQLTRQLLAFSRRQIIEPKIININTVLMDMDKLLRRLIGEDIELVTLPDHDLWQINIDPGQIEQVLTNMVINARDAMPRGGKLTIETSNVVLDGSYLTEHTGASTGDHVMFAVTDTGIGMDEKTRSRIFEPFFTTKDKGRGTGLGLSTCYGIVKQNNGSIWVYSEPNHGTTFKVYFPRAFGKNDIPPKLQDSDAYGGSETILVVEDEPLVRRMVVDILVDNGYNIMEASNGEEAVRRIEEEDCASINLLLTDVIMPRMGGRELARRFSGFCPEGRVLFMSGYTDDSIVHHGVLEAGIDFIQKPFSPSTILKKVRNVLDKQNV